MSRVRSLASLAGRVESRQTIAYYVVFVALGLTSASLGPTLPGLAGRTGVGLAQAGVLFSARSLGYLTGSLAGGRLYDRVAAHPLMAAALLIMGTSMALVPAARWIWLLVALLFLVGLAQGTIDTGGNALLVWALRDRVGPYMNGLHFFWGLGAFLSPVIVAQALLLLGDIGPAYWLIALVILPLGALLPRVPSPSSRPPAAAEGRVAANFRLVLPVMLFFFLYVGGEVSFGGWIYSYALAQRLAEPASAALLTSGFWGAVTLGRLLSMPLALRFSARALLMGDLLVCLAGLAAIVLWPGSLAVAWFGTVVIGLGMASIFPTVLSFAGRRMHLTGQVTGLFLVGASAGAMSMPLLAGQLFARLGPTSAMLLIALLFTLDLALLAGVLLRSSPQRASV